MTTAELKINIFRQIDTMDKGRLKEVYGIIKNLTSSDNDIDEWTLLSEKQQKGILDAVDEANAEKLVSHDEVMSKAYEKLGNALHR